MLNSLFSQIWMPLSSLTLILSNTITQEQDAHTICWLSRFADLPRVQVLTSVKTILLLPGSFGFLVLTCSSLMSKSVGATSVFVPVSYLSNEDTPSLFLNFSHTSEERLFAVILIYCRILRTHAICLSYYSAIVHDDEGIQFQKIFWFFKFP